MYFMYFQFILSHNSSNHLFICFTFIGADLNFLQSSPEDPHAVATLLKMYLRERM